MSEGLAVPVCSTVVVVSGATAVSSRPQPIATRAITRTPINQILRISTPPYVLDIKEQDACRTELVDDLKLLTLHLLPAGPDIDAIDPRFPANCRGNGEREILLR